jgi:hypothetical protein
LEFLASVAKQLGASSLTRAKGFKVLVFDTREG